MTGQHRNPGDPYDVGFAKPPKKTQFKKGHSGNPNGRPRKKPDLYLELTKVLHEKVNVTMDGQPEKVTVQEALLLRLRDQALQGEIWAGKLVQKVVEAIPDSLSEYDHIERKMGLFRVGVLANLIFDESVREKLAAAANSVETTNGEG
jgi:hypothetical protein